jgi:hypothetical protein
MLRVQQFFPGIAKQPFNLFVGLNDTAFTIDNEERIGSEFEQALEHRLGFDEFLHIPLFVLFCFFQFIDSLA